MYQIRLNVLGQEFEARSDSVQDDDLSTNQKCNIRSGFECRTERRGRARLEISQSQLEALNIDAGISLERHSEDRASFKQNVASTKTRNWDTS